MQRKLWILALLFATGCAGVVKQAHVRDDWETAHRDQVKRLFILVQPLPDGKGAVGEMWAAIAARHVDLKREFIIKELKALPEDSQDPLAAACGGGDVEAVLHLRPQVVRSGSGAEASLDATLRRCADGLELWRASSAGAWGMKDKKLTETIAGYTREFGPEVEPYVVASWHLLRSTLDTLPEPLLSEEDQLEKIEHGQ